MQVDEVGPLIIKCLYPAYHDSKIVKTRIDEIDLTTFKAAYVISHTIIKTSKNGLETIKRVLDL